MSQPGPVLHLVVPDGVDDPRRASGGDRYDARIRDGLRDRGWRVVQATVAGGWPHPDRDALDRLDRALAMAPEGATVVVDGLLASCAPELLPRPGGQARPTVIVHLPLGVEDPARRDAEASALAGAERVVTTSAWTRTWLLEHYPLPPERVHVVPPGVDAAPLAEPGRGDRLLCVGRVTPTKGQDLLLDALALLQDRDWSCVCAGETDVAPGFASRVREAAARFAGRVELTGPLGPAELAAAYAAADLLVVPSRTETYGMVVTEALARGLPVLATDVGGVPEALGGAGSLVPPQDPPALAAALDRWLTTPALRARRRAAARSRREELPGWADAAGRFATVLADRRTREAV